MTDISDELILEKFGDEEKRSEAFNLLIKKYQQKLYWHIRRIVISHDDADDVIQNTFIKIWTGLIHFRQESQLYSWLYRIATNESINFLRKKRLRLFVPFVNVEQHLSQSLKDDNFFTGDEVERKLQHAILQLPEKQRIVFNMKYYGNMKYEEISEILGTSVGALKASFHLAVQKIEKNLKRN